MLGASVQLDGSLDIEDGILASETMDTMNQWSFLVPLIGGRYHIIPQLAVYTTYILLIGWLYINYPPIKGTRNNYWMNTRIYSHRNQRWTPLKKDPPIAPKRKCPSSNHQFSRDIFIFHWFPTPIVQCFSLERWLWATKVVHPGRLTAGSPTAITHEKKGISSSTKTSMMWCSSRSSGGVVHPPLFQTCCLCNPWLWCSKRHRCYPQWSQPGKR